MHYDNEKILQRKIISQHNIEFVYFCENLNFSVHEDI